MAKTRLKSFSNEIPTRFKFLNLCLLIPISIWPLILYGTIFIFDNPQNLLVAYLLFFVINAYPIYLLIIAELNARLYLKNKRLSFILPTIVIIFIIYTAVYIIYSMISTANERVNEREKRAEEGWLGWCDSYRIKDTNSVFYRDTIIIQADVATIKYVDCHYAKDKNYVYKGTNIIRGADPDSFQILDWKWQKDKNHCFYLGKLIPYVDVNTFQLLQANYSKDRSNVYYYEKIVERADPKTFEVDNFTHIGKDKYRTYKNGK